MSDTTQSPGVSDISSASGQEAAFQGMFESGAFNESGQLDEIDKKIIEGQDQTPRAAEEDAPAPEETEEGQEQAPQWKSFDEFLTASKAEREAVMALPVTIKVDGVEKQVPLSDLVKVTQLEGHVNNKSIALSQAQQKFMDEQQAVRQFMGQQVSQAKNLGNAAMQLLNQDFQQVDWQTLRATDPARYAAIYADFQQRQGAIQNYLGTIAQQEQQQAQQRQQEMNRAIEVEREKLFGAIPEWRDEAKFTEARDNFTKYARNVGLTDAELGAIADHRILRILHDAAQYATLQAKTPEVLNKVRAAPPKTARPGTRTQAQPGEAKRAETVQRFKDNPHDPDIQAAMFEMYG